MSLICYSSSLERYMTYTRTFLRSYQMVPSNSMPLARVYSFSFQQTLWNYFGFIYCYLPDLGLLQMSFTLLPAGQIRKLRSLFSFLQRSFASPTLIVSSQSLSFLVLISVSFRETSFFHNLYVALDLPPCEAPKLLKVSSLESLFLLRLRSLCCSSSCCTCLLMKSETLPSVFLQTSTFLMTLSMLKNCTCACESYSISSMVYSQPMLSSSYRNYYVVRQSLLVFQKWRSYILCLAMKELMLWQSLIQAGLG